MTSYSSRIRLAMLATAGAAAFAPRLTLPGAAARAQATPGADSLDALPVVEIVATDFAFTLPAEIAAGWTRLHLRNWGAEDHHAQLLRLHTDVTFDQLVAAFQEQGEAALVMVDLAGGPGTVHPGGVSEAVVLLEPGAYAVACFITGPSGHLHIALGMMTPLTVTAATGESAPPTPDIAVELRDFAYSMPAKIPAGRVVIEATNIGPEPHEFAVLHLADDATHQSVIAMLTGGMTMAGEHGATPMAGGAPFEMYGGLQGIAPGMTGYAILDFVPGHYLAVCFIPSAANAGHPHAMLGMVNQFVVE
jgi:hypothetical protein